MTHLAPSTVKGIAAAYALLALVTVGAIAGGYAAYESHGLAAEVAHVQAGLGDQNLTRLADKAITQQAQSQGFGVKKIVVRSVKEAGDVGTVDAVVTVTDGTSDQTVEVLVSFTKSTWQVSNLAAK